MSDDRRFPILKGGGETISWNLAQQAYRNYGSSQTLKRIAERGGFGWDELDALLSDKYKEWCFEKDISVARERVLSHDKSLIAEVEKLRAENERLRGVLGRIASSINLDRSPSFIANEALEADQP